MKKKLISFYGNSNYTTDIATIFAIECAKANIKTLLVELGEGTNPKLSYKLGIEDQRIKTMDYYLQNINKGVYINVCTLNKQDICDLLTDREKALADLIKKLPNELSILPRKAPSDDPQLTEDEYKKAIEKIRKEGFENNDIIVMALSGNCYSYPVFFSNLYADSPILITEDMPEDIRSLNKFAIDMKKITDFNVTSIYLDYGSDVSLENFEKTAMNVVYAIPLKSILKLRILSSRAYSGEIPNEITEIAKNIALGIEEEPKKKFIGLFADKEKARKEAQNE